ncbi:hypothetical protein BUALT_Bualt01G0193000 [Buddleja alternifolia]|uniref:PGG domain-containing protein n=1 Tax=Buddleja alternifolia TaxID=168488 RepID=A0AAV6YFC3_9LAMI|nr:hypothetical protein BUALT_Bualt01G0193000 [Buddleja alternifolia]
MDQRLFAAACSGDINTLYQLLQQNPFILSDYHLINSHENPLTIATKANHVAFVHEILQIKPELSIELNQDGLWPLDVASAYGHVEIVGEILAAAGPGICQRPGRDGRTAIHYAAMNGRVDIIDKLISACPASAKDVTAFGESVLHLDVKHFRVEAFRSMLEKFDMVEIIELLLDWNNRSGNKLELNAVNRKGLTAMDILDILLESSTDFQLREALRRAGAYPLSELPIDPETPKNPTNNRLPGEKPKKWRDIVKHFEFQWQRDSPGEARATLLLVATLIATVTFEAGINPPSYLFQRRNRVNASSNNTNMINSNVTEALNEMQRSSSETSTLLSITVFLVANSVALSTATSIIDYLTVGLPFQRELRVSMLAMIFAYSWSMANTRPTGTVKTVLLAVAISMPFFLRALPYMMKKILKCRKRNA